MEEVRWQDGYLIGRVFVDGKNVCTGALSEASPDEASDRREPGA